MDNLNEKNSFIKLSCLLRDRIHPLLHGALISRIISNDEQSLFCAVSSFNKSKKLNADDLYLKASEKYLEILNKKTGLLWVNADSLNMKKMGLTRTKKGPGKALLIIENDIKITKESFFNKLYSKLFNECEWIYQEGLNEDKKDFIRGFCELRGSIDTSRKYLTMDYFFDNKFELKKGRLLIDYLSVPSNVVNINFRELQKQFVEEINKRNTQFRISLDWYCDNVGILNEYKVNIIKVSYEKENFLQNDAYYTKNWFRTKKSELFGTRLNYYLNNIYDRTISEEDVEKMRSNLNLKQNENYNYTRNRIITEIVRMSRPDICSGCEGVYKLENRTFISSRTKRPYFEIHHNISLGQNKALDHEDNLVKLCPACHANLKKGVASDYDQRKIIERILDKNENLKDFSSNFFDCLDKKDLINKIQQGLK